jgi:hypothetical protein
VFGHRLSVIRLASGGYPNLCRLAKKT